MIIRSLLTRLGFQVDESQLRRYEGATQNIRRQADAAADSFRNMFLAFAGFGAIQSISKTADEMQSLEARVGQLPQTITSAADAFDLVAQRATDARGSINAYANFYIKLQNSGKDFIKTQEEGLKITDTITKALVLGGATATEQASTLLQFGQAIGSNELLGEEFRALSESAPQLIDAISKQLGIARGDLKKYASEGKLTSKVIIEAVSAIANEFDERFKQMPITIGQATTIIGNRWAVFLNRMNRESSAVTSIANAFIDGFDMIEAALNRMVDFFGGATNTVKAFGIALGAVLAPLLFRTAVGAILLLLSPIGLLVTGLTVLGLVIEDVYQWMNWGDSAIEKYLSGLAGMGVVVGVIDKVKKAFAELFAEGSVVGKSIAALGRLKDYLARIIPFDEIMANMSQMFSGFISMFFGVLDVIAGLFKTTLGFLTGDFDLWYEGVKQIVGGLGDVFSGVWELIKGVFKQNLVGIQVMFRIAFDAVKSIVTDSIYGGIVWAAKKGWEFLKSLFGFGVSADVNVNQPKPITMGMTGASVASSTVAGAAASPNGVPIGGGGVNVTVNQTLPPGTPQETANAAQSAVTQAFNAMPTDRLARQLGQIQ